MFRRLEAKILLVIGTAVTLGLVSLVLFFSEQEERNILAQNQRTLLKLVDSTRQGLKTLMLSGYGDVGQVFAEGLEGLETLPGVVDLRVIRPDGSEAFADNRTLDRVNRLAGYERFYPREEQNPRQVLPADQAQLQQVLDSGERADYYAQADGERLYTLLAPVRAEPACHECHRENSRVLGVIKLTTSLADVDRNIALSRLQSGLILVVTVLLIMAVVRGFVVRRLLMPIEALNRALQRVSQGKLEQELAVPQQTELALMAESFNRMTRELRNSYAGLQQERNTLTTIIQGAREGMIATDEAGQVVLVNPAAQALLGKAEEQIRAGGLEGLFDDPQLLAQRLASTDSHEQRIVIEYNSRVLSVQLATIEDTAGQRIGSAALIRDITEEALLRRQLQHESRTDTLTGLYNRRYLDRQLAHELRLAHRYQRWLALVLFDVDHFKAFNDRHGHECGDRVLRQVAKVSREVLRRVDILCRYGGEEFVIIMPELDEEAALALAQTLRQAIAAMAVDGEAVTASFGVAWQKPGQGREPAAILRAADEALYRAKQGGRNRVEAEE